MLTSQSASLHVSEQLKDQRIRSLTDERDKLERQLKRTVAQRSQAKSRTKQAEQRLHALKQIAPNEIANAKLKELQLLRQAMQERPAEFARQRQKREATCLTDDERNENRKASKRRNEARRSAGARRRCLRLREALLPAPALMAQRGLGRPPTVIKPPGSAPLDPILLGQGIPMSDAYVCLEGLFDIDRSTLRRTALAGTKPLRRGLWDYRAVFAVLRYQLSRSRGPDHCENLSAVVLEIQARVETVAGPDHVASAVAKLAQAVCSKRLEFG